MQIEMIQEIIDRNVAETTAHVGVLFKDLKTDEQAGIAASDAFPTASVFKIFILAELFRQIELGTVRFTDRLEMTEEMRSCGSSIMRQLDAGCCLTIKDLATLMMIVSDNTATDLLFKLVGRDNIRKNVIDALGLTKTKADLPCKILVPVCYGMKAGTSYDDFYRLYPGLKDKLHNTEPYLCTMKEDDVTSPEDVSKVLELMYRGEWVTPERSEQALSIMKKCQTNTRIPARLPYGVSVAHKTGSMDRVSNDAGIVYTEKGDYILSLFFNGNTASKEEYDRSVDCAFADGLMAKISREIYDEYTG